MALARFSFGLFAFLGLGACFDMQLLLLGRLK